IEEEMQTIRRAVTLRQDRKQLSIRRMANRWEVRGGTPQHEWREDAKNSIRDIIGLKTLEWVDSTYHVRWTEPHAGNEKAVGLNIRYDKERTEALEDAGKYHTILVTPPVDLVQGYKGILAYAPIHIKGKFDGFIVALFSVEALMRQTYNEDF